MLKSTHKPKEVKTPIEYPCLMITKGGKIVLFKEYGKGTIVVPRINNICNDHLIGYYSEHWAMQDFEPYKGEITIVTD